MTATDSDMLVKEDSSLHFLLDANKKWAKAIEDSNPDFFMEQNAGQAPSFLWIGCSDSRVPPNHITATNPGDIFVHRNIGNAVLALDLNANAVMQYAVDVLKVKHLIVCGHYKCGAVHAALGHSTGLPIIEQWIAHIRTLDAQFHDTLKRLPPQVRFDLMCELNAITNAKNACLSVVVQNAWKRGQKLVVHGWCYRLANGIIEDLNFEVDDPKQVEYTFEAAMKHAIKKAVATQ
ncbi:hypothetical protein HDV04_003089 [Boothiomyces sp. JEL0838]|nr:hypothetical protein HDV04_003089 [Boothiomyces sp. JEL0838]